MVEMTALQIAASLLVALAVVLCMVRLLLGPETLDRLVAADTLAVIVTTVLASLAALFESPLYLDVALIFATLAFVGTVAIARVMERPEE